MNCVLSRALLPKLRPQARLINHSIRLFSVTTNKMSKSQEPKILESIDCETEGMKWIKLRRINWQDQTGRKVCILFWKRQSRRLKADADASCSEYGSQRTVRLGKEILMVSCVMLQCLCVSFLNVFTFERNSRCYHRSYLSPKETSLHRYHRAIPTPCWEIHHRYVLPRNYHLILPLSLLTGTLSFTTSYRTSCRFGR
jgi:hypothetical protein